MQHARSVEGLWCMGEGPSMHRPTSTVHLLCPYHNEHETSVPKCVYSPPALRRANGLLTLSPPIESLGRDRSQPPNIFVSMPLHRYRTCETSTRAFRRSPGPLPHLRWRWQPQQNAPSARAGRLLLELNGACCLDVTLKHDPFRSRRRGSQWL